MNSKLEPFSSNYVYLLSKTVQAVQAVLGDAFTGPYLDVCIRVEPNILMEMSIQMDETLWSTYAPDVSLQ